MCLYIILGIICLIILLRNIEWVIRSFYISNLTDKYVLITGCDTGFGNLLAKRLDKKGLNVIAVCLFEKSSKELARECSPKLTTVVMNVCHEDAVDNLKQIVKEKVGVKGLYALVNNAGIGRRGSGSIETFQKACLEEMLSVNTIAPAMLCFKFVDLINQAGGRIVNMASIAGRIQSANLLYGITKNAVEGLSSILSFQLKKYGWNVSVHTLEPGRFMTSIHQKDMIREEITDSYTRASDWTKKKYETEEKYIEKFMQPMKDFQATASTNIDEVIDAYEHAVLSIWPKNRYTVGLSTKYFLIPLAYFPTTISDAILMMLED